MVVGLPDQVLPSGAGVRRPPLFFLQSLKAWNAKQSGKVGASSPGGAAGKPGREGKRNTAIHATSGGAAAADAVTVQVQPFPPTRAPNKHACALQDLCWLFSLDCELRTWPASQVESPDVHEERLRVEAMSSYDGQAMIIRDLHKVYPGQVRGFPPVQFTLGSMHARNMLPEQLLSAPVCFWV